MSSPDPTSASGSQGPESPGGADSPSRHLPQGRDRRWLLFLAAFVLACLILHRPVLHTGGRLYLVHVARKAGFDLKNDVSGNVWNRLQLSEVRLTPLANDHPTLESLYCARVEVKYSLARMLWSGPGESIRSYRIQTLELYLHSLRSPRTSPAPQPWLPTLEKVLALPALYADEVQLEDVSIRIADGHPFEQLRGGRLSAFPDRPGEAGFESVVFTTDNTPSSPAGKGAFARTQYSDRKLELSDLPLTPDLRLERFAFDASERVHGRARVEVALASAHGRLHAGLFVQKPGFAHGAGSPTRPLWRVEIGGKSFPLKRLLEPLGTAHALAPDLDWIETNLEGDPREPLSWKGQTDVRGRHPLPGGQPLHAELHAGLRGGTVFFENTHAATPQSRADFTGWIQMPAAWNRGADWNAALQWKASSRNIGEWFAAPGNQASGACQLEGDLSVRAGTLQSRTHAGAAALRLESGTIGAAHFSVEAVLPLDALSDFTTASRALSGRAAGHFENTSLLRQGSSFVLHRADIAGTLAEGTLHVQSADLESGPNRAKLQGKWESAGGPQKPACIRDAGWEIACPSLEKSGLRIRGLVLGGSFASHGGGDWRPGLLSGTGSLSGERLRWGDAEAASLFCKITAHGTRARLESLRVNFNPEGFLSVTGQMDLEGEHAYEGTAQVRMPKLAAVAPLFQQLGLEGSPAGEIEATWKGDGKGLGPEATGAWSLQGRNLEWKTLKLQNVQFHGSYVPGRIDASELRITSGETAVQARLHWIRGRLEVPTLRVEQGGREVLSGTLRLPVDFDSSGVHWLDDARLDGELRAQKFNLGTLWKTAPSRPPLTGTVDLLLTLEGTPETPLLALRTESTGIQTQLLPNFPKFNLRLEASHQNGLLQAELSVDSALGGPARVKAVLPLPLKALLHREAWQTVGLNAHIEWPRVKLSALPLLWGGFRNVQGDASIHGEIGGSWNALQWSGDLKIDCPVLHFANDRLPAVSDLRVAVHGGDGRVRIQTLRADLGGGSLEIRGEARGADLNNPDLDLNILAHQVLVQRSEQLSLRLDGNLRIAGPLQGAAVTGRVTPVKSMLRRDIEVLPVTALTQTTGGYRRPPGKPWFTFPRGPLADWTFDVGIVSRPEDPILIRGNRLRGTALSDIRFQGTGKTPTLSGSYQTHNLQASLPFARLEVTRGRLWYNPADPFAAEVDLSAETEVRSHRIRLYLHGPPESPAITVTSDPPLPERDALTLLTTGALPGMFGVESTQSVTTRAAGLLLQEFSDKFLGNPTSSRERFTALRRFNLEMGAINNRTGTQETRLTYRLMDNLFVIGEVGANGDFASRLRYVLRFR